MRRHEGKTVYIVNITKVDSRKEGIARLVRRWPLSYLMGWAIRLVVPRQRIGVALVAFNAREEVFLLRHVYHPSSPWGLPGGWLGRNEAPSAGVIRELREETGLDVVLGPAIHVNHDPDPGSIVIGYLGWIQPGPVRLSHEILEARWFDLAHLPPSLHPFTHQAIAVALAQHRLQPAPRPSVTRTESVQMAEELAL